VLVLNLLRAQAHLLSIVVQLAFFGGGSATHIGGKAPVRFVVHSRLWAPQREGELSLDDSLERRVIAALHGLAATHGHEGDEGEERGSGDDVRHARDGARLLRGDLDELHDRRHAAVVAAVGAVVVAAVGAVVVAVNMPIQPDEIFAMVVAAVGAVVVAAVGAGRRAVVVVGTAHAGRRGRAAVVGAVVVVVGAVVARRARRALRLVRVLRTRALARASSQADRLARAHAVGRSRAAAVAAHAAAVAVVVQSEHLVPTLHLPPA